MTIRRKIFLLAGVLLVLFGAVIGTLAFTQKLDHDQLVNISEYELPLSKLVAEFDVDTDRYELHILRVLRSENLTAAEQEAETASARKLADEMRNTVATSDALLSKATQDPSYKADDRVELARIGGVLKYLSRGLEEFLAVGDTTLAAAAAGKHEEARQLLWGLQNFHKPLVRTSPRFVLISLI